MNTETLILLKPYLDAFTVAFLPIVAALVARYLSKKDQHEKWQIAVARAAGTAYKEVVQSGRSLKDPEVLARASAAGVSYLFDLNPEGAAALKAPGLAPRDIAQRIVEAEIGKFMRDDPAVKVAA
jgi:hypothetical protein